MANSIPNQPISNSKRLQVSLINQQVNLPPDTSPEPTCASSCSSSACPKVEPIRLPSGKPQAKIKIRVYQKSSCLKKGGKKVYNGARPQRLNQLAQDIAQSISSPN